MILRGVSIVTHEVNFMHKYLHHIGDFMRDTSHLSPVEECFYRRALDWYYLNEKPFPNDMKEVFRLLRAKGKIQTQAVETVFKDFFFAEENYLKNSRCEKEITAYKEKNNSNRVNGKLGGRPKKNSNLENHSGFDSVNDGLSNKTHEKGNHKPITNNHKPITSNQYKYTFDLEFVNVNLMKTGSKTVDQEYINELQPQFELYYADQHMADNKALVKFVQWIVRNQQKEQIAKPVNQNSWAEYNQGFAQQLNQTLEEPIDITPKKSVLIEEVGHA
ncbi:YdaU family protein [Acinetobacter sp. ULE_I080]